MSNKLSIRGYFKQLPPPGPQPPYKLSNEDAAFLKSCDIGLGGYVLPDSLDTIHELLDELNELSMDPNDEQA